MSGCGSYPQGSGRFRRVEVSEESIPDGSCMVVARVYAESLPEARNLLLQDILTRYASLKPLEVAWPAPEAMSTTETKVTIDHSALASMIADQQASPRRGRRPGRKPGRPRKS